MLEENSNLMDELDVEIETVREEVEDARTKALQADARYNIKQAQVTFACKAEKMTDTATKAKATMDSVDDFNAWLLCDAIYRGKRARLDTLIEKKESIKERNYNERASMKVFG
jgi:hypothetical protein